MANAELTAENKPAFVPPDLVFSSVDGSQATHEDEVFKSSSYFLA